MGVSSEAMDDSFRVRVEKVFGSLTSASSNKPSSSLQSTLWSLTDDEVERREWRRGTDSDRDEIPCSSSFDESSKDRIGRRNFRRNFRDDQEEEEEEELNRLCRGCDYEWEIRSSIGLDATLDHEEEEDEYDKVASGRQNGDRHLYMKNVTDQSPYLNCDNVLSKSLYATKDPRANHLAAKIRLQEDEAEAQKLNSDYDWDADVKELHVKPLGEEHGQLRSILKRKNNNNSEFKSNKHVRFDPVCKSVCEEDASENIQDISIDLSSVSAIVSDYGSMSSQNASGVPDYLRNPSKYTCYSFNSSGEVIDEKSNSQAYMNFLKLVKSSKPTELGTKIEDVSADLPRSVIFIPKKKAGEVRAINNGDKPKQDKEDDGNQSVHHSRFPVGIAAGESQHSEAGAMEDHSETNAVEKSAGFQKPGHRYRVKSSPEDFDA